VDGPARTLVEYFDRVDGDNRAADRDRTRRRLLVGLSVVSIPSAK
jgi:hypothetical protein